MGTNENNGFNLKYVKLIVKNDFKQIRDNKEIFLTMILLPVLFSVAMPLLMGIGAITDPESFTNDTALSAYEVMIIYIINMTLKPMFLFIPGTVSMMIASDSFAGEKERKTAETILVLPITHKELYIGKMLTAMIPSVVFSWISFAIMGVEINLIASSIIPPGAPLFIFGDISFWLMALIMAPLLSLVNVQAGIMISARSKDIKSAQTISGALIIPLLGIMFVGILNPNILGNIWILLIISGILGIIIYLLTLLGAKLINRERLVANIG